MADNALKTGLKRRFAENVYRYHTIAKPILKFLLYFRNYCCKNLYCKV